MPLLKPVSTKRKRVQIGQAQAQAQAQAQTKAKAKAKDILKMYKYFHNLNHQETRTQGCFITRVLMDNSYIWQRITKHGCARGIPGGLRERKWKVEGFTLESPESLRLKWKAQGWILPRNYWVGPRELKPQVEKTQPIKLTILPESLLSLMNEPYSSNLLNLKEDQLDLGFVQPPQERKKEWDDLTPLEKQTILEKFGFNK